MSAHRDTNCVLSGPGHNLPSELALDTVDAIPFTDSIRYEGVGVFRIGDNCSCHSVCNRRPKDPEEFLGDSDFAPSRMREDETREIIYPFPNMRMGCEALFTVHDPARLLALISEPKIAIKEVNLKFDQSRVLIFPDTGETFWLKGNDGSITRNTAVFDESAGHISGCTGILFHTFKVNGPCLSDCMNSKGGVFRATNKTDRAYNPAHRNARGNRQDIGGL